MEVEKCLRKRVKSIPHIQAIMPEKREIAPLKQRIRDFEMDKEILKKPASCSPN
jgi:hypothetical protein